MSAYNRYNPLVVSNYFVDKSIQTGVEMTPMKLLKLVYLSHGWYLGYNQRPLISEAVLAWQYGPVIQSVYHRFKKYGGNQITQLSDLNGDGMVNQLEYIPNEPTILKFLDLIWNTYKNYNGLQLSTITHETGSPWDTVVKNQGVGHVISNDLIREYYSSMIEVNGAERK